MKNWIISTDEKRIEELDVRKWRVNELWNDAKLVMKNEWESVNKLDWWIMNKKDNLTGSEEQVNYERKYISHKKLMKWIILTDEKWIKELDNEEQSGNELWKNAILVTKYE